MRALAVSSRGPPLSLVFRMSSVTKRQMAGFTRPTITLCLCASLYSCARFLVSTLLCPVWSVCDKVCDAEATCEGNGRCNNDGGCECRDPFSGEACGKCQAGSFGIECKGKCDEEHTCIAHGRFMGTAESCECFEGFEGPNCDSCVVDFFGPQCIGILLIYFFI